ncbi:hypothetical protein N748_05505 [Legionella pneumophila str. 121004]|nr:hypothetical protein LPE509_02416 [Legionella pneumophila subsp. pneumophila LPE509]ERB42164.1 hypothetical protein N748_05505 [Legionella pneumophila str. 121004]ERH43299.1 hypothetical protein N750_12740 [Legionella pneumophila str. Leg01/53]ERH44959.1 hypothetical protein N751_12500 [Legionella pneumophila str. Leg01/11]ERI49290.1 hypothetical protein N749_05575 [Legionella pneumophila str. Leg01/20]
MIIEKLQRLPCLFLYVIQFAKLKIYFFGLTLRIIFPGLLVNAFAE